MIKIITDSSTLFDRKQSEQLGIGLCPLHILIDGQGYEDIEELSSSQLLTMIKEGKIPHTSQPSFGEKLELYDLYAKDHEVIDIAMAKGLSGTYDSAVMAKNSSKYPENINVVNTKTLCGPHQRLVKEALKLSNQGASKETILTMLNASIETESSFLIPTDFSFLERGGRVSQFQANIGSLLKLKVVMKKSDDGQCIEKLTVARTTTKLMQAIKTELDKKNVDASYEFYISHADNLEIANKLRNEITKYYENAHVEILALSPAFITQGGPGCVALQTIKIISNND
ncbi:MAG: DegV family protein [Erysipelotrichaceae bacterium]|nr:DegV family protein [Erysipelotrichaceae bacterium]MDY5252814.1 DegV family protein [Erysipelotrichaceae bacterium]